MNAKRYLCSQLVALRNNRDEAAATIVVNLEEIWSNGAVLESEEPVEQGAMVEIRCDTALFTGRIVQVEGHEVGWRLEMEFSPATLWNPEHFQPMHLLDVSKLDRKTD